MTDRDAAMLAVLGLYVVPTVIVLFLSMLAISVAECLVCLLRGDL